MLKLPADGALHQGGGGAPRSQREDGRGAHVQPHAEARRPRPERADPDAIAHRLVQVPVFEDLASALVPPPGSRLAQRHLDLDPRPVACAPGSRGRESTRRRPPRLATRSRMAARPKAWRGVAASKPTPSSSMVMATPPILERAHRDLHRARARVLQHVRQRSLEQPVRAPSRGRRQRAGPSPDAHLHLHSRAALNCRA